MSAFDARHCGIIRFRSLALVSAIVIAAACSSGSGGGGTPRASPSSGRWVASRAYFETPKGASPRRGDLEVARVIAVRGGWAAIGSVDGRDFAAWRSRDGVNWQLTQYKPETQSEVFPNVNAIVRSGTALVAAGSSHEHPAVWVSRDDGTTWSRVSAAALAVNGAVSDAVAVHGVVALAGQRGTGSPRPAAWLMRDLTRVEPAAVQGATRAYDTITGVADLGTGLVAVGTVSPRPAAWLSHDDGASWRAVSSANSVARGGLQQVIRLRGKLVASGQYYRSADAPPAGYVWQSNTDAREWEPVLRHSGSFGDGRETRVWQLAAFRDAALMVGGARDRANPNFCYDDLSTCDQNVAALWLSTDGQKWGRVAVPHTTENDRFSTVAIDASGVLMLGSRFDLGDGNSTLRVWRWIGPKGALPASTVPPEQQFEKPRHELIERYDAQLEAAHTYRFVVPIGGGCGAGRLYFNAKAWQVVRPWGEAPYPKTWPVRHMNNSDAPTDYLDGTVRVADSGHLEVGIEDGPILRTYEPTKVQQPPCG